MDQMITRTPFVTSRLLDFFSEQELAAQCGHALLEWPLVAMKEGVDNALDDCEEAGIPPEIKVTVTSNAVTIEDNGTGLPSTVIDNVLDYGVRVSSRSAYAGPTRGMQGNALKTLVAMPCVWGIAHGDKDRGSVEIVSQGRRHLITVAVDAIRQVPDIVHHIEDDELGRNGTSITITFPDSARSQFEELSDDFLQVANRFGTFNPHLDLVLDLFGDRYQAGVVTDPAWSKWRPRDPAPSGWYSPEQLSRLISANIFNGCDMPCREFVAQFRGLSSTAKHKAILESLGLSRLPLSALVVDRAVSIEQCTRLLNAMNEHSRPVKPELLGILGREHLQAELEAYGGIAHSFVYRKVEGETLAGLPYVVEAAFAMCEDDDDDGDRRRIFTGVNFSPALRSPFRNLRGVSLDGFLADRYVSEAEPALVAVHLTMPSVAFTDRGKSAVTLPGDVALAVLEAVGAVTRRWARQRESEVKDHSKRLRRHEEMTKASRPKKLTTKDASWQVMEDAYMMASANNTLPANARQIMYAARPLMLALTGKQFSDSYFTQQLLPDFLAENPDITEDWDVVYDARGHFREPHTDREFGLGTIEVREYLDDIASHKKQSPLSDFRLPPAWLTCGPLHRFGGLVFIEKEGFDELVKAAKLAERLDVAFMSCKGMSVTAARRLAESICAVYQIPLIVLHDFDKSGFSICSTLQRDTRRYTFETAPVVYDIGLRLEDIEGLEREPVVNHGSDDAVIDNLRLNGATEAEIEILLTHRVELNAMTSDQFVAFVERKLDALGIRKIVPDAPTLEAAWRRARTLSIARTGIADVIRATEAAVAAMPVPDLEREVRRMLLDNPALPWDAAIEALAE